MIERISRDTFDSTGSAGAVSTCMVSTVSIARATDATDVDSFRGRDARWSRREHGRECTFWNEDCLRATELGVCVSQRFE